MDEVVRYAVYPCIGIARVGNSPDEFFVGPEAPGEVPRPEGGFKDADGRVKRQAARFRVYGLNEAGEAVREITANEAEITWRVHLANRKAAWYQFLNAMEDRKSTRLNSSHANISYAVFCLKKKKT